jgi:hypothetical protein
MKIDIHNHPDWHGYDLVKFLKNMDLYNIDKTWLLSWISPEDEYDPMNIKYIPDPGPGGPIPFARCLSYTERAPERFVLGYAPDPRRPHAIDHLRAAVDIYGVKVYGELKLRMMYDDPDALRMFRFCAEKRLPVILHIDYEFDTDISSMRPSWWYGGGIDAFERAVSACQDTAFLGHAPGFWAHISGDDRFDKESYPSGRVVPGGRLISMLRKYDNLYCDISAGSGCNALKRDPEFAETFLTEFQDKILYGRDYFDNSHQEILEGLGISRSILDKIYYINALKLVP